MLQGKSNKRNKICSNLLVILSKGSTAMAVPAVLVATAMHIQTYCKEEILARSKLC